MPALHLQRIRGEAALLVRALELAQARLARLELGAHGGVERGEALLFDLRALAELRGEDLRAGGLEFRDGALLERALLRDRLQARGLGGRARLGERGAAVEALAFEFEPRGRELGAGGGDFELRGIRRALDFGIRQLDDDGVGGRRSRRRAPARDRRAPSSRVESQRASRGCRMPGPRTLRSSVPSFTSSR